MRGEAQRLQTLLLSSYLLDFIQYIYPHILTLWLSIRYGILGGPTAACSIWMSPLGDISTDVTFEIDDSVIIENGFACCDAYPQELSETMLTLTGANPFCARVYSDGNASFVVECGQFLGQDWIHISNNPPDGFSEFFEAESMLRGPERVRSMVDVPSRTELYGRVWVNHISLPESTWIVRTSRVVWERSRIGVRMEIFHHFGFYNGLNEWKILGVEVGSVFVACTWHCCTIIYRELMIPAVTCGVSCWTIVCHVNVSIYYT